MAAGWTASPEWLPQALRVYVMTAAMSVSESCFHGGIAVPGLPFSTSAICASAGPLTTLEPSSAGNVPGTPLPLAWWHAAQLASKTFVAFGGQIRFRPHLARVLGGRGRFLLLVGDPRRVVVLRLHLDDDRHEAVFLAAQFGALAAVGADLLRLEPRVADEARNRVLLHAERRHRPRVQHVAGRDDHAHLGADRHDHRLVHFQQVVRALRYRGSRSAQAAWRDSSRTRILPADSRSSTSTGSR